MIRKFLLAAAITTVALTGLALSPSSANADSPFGPPHRIERDCDRYEVLVRHRGHWDIYESFRDRNDARRAAWHLRHRGLEVEVRRV